MIPDRVPCSIRSWGWPGILCYREGGRHMAPWAPAFRGDLTGELPGTNRFYERFQTPLEEYVF